MRRLPLLLALAGPLLALPPLVPAVLAQGIGRSAPPPTAGAASRPPPPALPGLAGRRAPEPIPAETPAANLSPNAALFDAINRGDLGAAREAMGRGADLNARNQLGLTPVDASVDQGRTEITFYLLSARGSAGSGPILDPSESSAPPPPAPAAGRRGRTGRGAPAAPDPAAPGVASSDDGRPTARLSGSLSDPPRDGARRAGPATPLRARLFAGDGGTPRPEIGFLGFDAGRPAGAAPLAGVPDEPVARQTRSTGRATGRGRRAT